MTAKTEQAPPTSEDLRQRVRDAELALREAQIREAEDQRRARVEETRASALRTIEQRKTGIKNWERQVDAAKKELKRLDSIDVTVLRQATALGDGPSQRALDDLETAKGVEREKIRQATDAIEGPHGCKDAIAEAERLLERTPSVEERAGILAAAGKALKTLRGEGD